MRSLFHTIMGSGGGGSFLPTDISDLRLWVDSSDFVSAGAISQWNDKSEMNNHLIQATGANQASVVLSVQNSKPIVRFDGVNDFFNLTTPIDQTTDYTCIQVIKAFDATSIVCGLSSGNTESTYPFLQFGSSSYTSDTYGYKYGTNDVTSFCAMTGSRASGVLSLLKNNGSFSLTTVVSGRPTNPFAVVGMLTSTYPTKGDIAEILYFNRVLTSQELIDLNTYLSTKWAL